MRIKGVGLPSDEKLEVFQWFLEVVSYREQDYCKDVNFIVYNNLVNDGTFKLPSGWTLFVSRSGGVVGAISDSDGVIFETSFVEDCNKDFEFALNDFLDFWLEKKGVYTEEVLKAIRDNHKDSLQDYLVDLEKDFEDYIIDKIGNYYIRKFKSEIATEKSASFKEVRKMKLEKKRFSKKAALSEGEVKEKIKEIAKKVWDDWKEEDVEYAFEEWKSDFLKREDSIPMYGQSFWYSHPDIYEWNFFEYLWDVIKDEAPEVYEYFNGDYSEFREFVFDNEDLYDLQVRYYKEVSDEVNKKIEEYLEEQDIYEWTYHSMDTDQPYIMVYPKSKKSASRRKRASRKVKKRVKFSKRKILAMARKRKVKSSRKRQASDDVLSKLEDILDSKDYCYAVNEQVSNYVNNNYNIEAEVDIVDDEGETFSEVVPITLRVSRSGDIFPYSSEFLREFDRISFDLAGSCYETFWDYVRDFAYEFEGKNISFDELKKKFDDYFYNEIVPGFGDSIVEELEEMGFYVSRKKTSSLRKRASGDDKIYYFEVIYFGRSYSQDGSWETFSHKYTYHFVNGVPFEVAEKYILQDIIQPEYLDKMVEVSSDLDYVEYEYDGCLSCFDENGEEVPCDSDVPHSCYTEGVAIFALDDESVNCCTDVIEGNVKLVGDKVVIDIE